MPVRTIEICQNTYRKSLPDVAAADDDTFFVVWAAAPDEESPTADYAIVCQKVSSTGALIGEPEVFGVAFLNQRHAVRAEEAIAPPVDQLAA